MHLFSLMQHSLAHGNPTLLHMSRPLMIAEPPYRSSPRWSWIVEVPRAGPPRAEYLEGDMRGLSLEGWGRLIRGWCGLR